MSYITEKSQVKFFHIKRLEAIHSDCQRRKKKHASKCILGLTPTYIITSFKVMLPLFRRTVQAAHKELMQNIWGISTQKIWKLANTLLYCQCCNTK